MKPMNSRARIGSSPNACTDCTTPERVMNVPKMVRKNVTMTSVTFQTRSMLRRSWTITECRNAVAVNHGSSAAFSTGSQRPVAAPAELFVGPDHPEDQTERQEQPAEHRPAPHRAQPRVVEVAGDQRGDAERERNRHADEAGVERWRVDRHVEVLQQRVEPLAVGRHLRQERRERVLVNHHQEQEEHLHDGDRRRPRTGSARGGARGSRRPRAIRRSTAGTPRT